MDGSNLKTEHDHLMNRWEQQLGGRVFIKDGPVDFDAYAAARARIVFVLKEPNIAPSVEEDRWCLSDVIEDRAATWGMLACWARGLQSEEPIEWRALPSATPANRRDWLKSTAVMNLHKGAGRTTTDMTVLEQQAGAVAHLIRNQLELLTPALIVACGTGDVLAPILLGQERPPQWTQLANESRVKVWSLQNLVAKPMRLLAVPHPQARMSSEAKYRLVVTHGRTLLGRAPATAPAPSR